MKLQKNQKNYLKSYKILKIKFLSDKILRVNPSIAGNWGKSALHRARVPVRDRWRRL